MRLALLVLIPCLALGCSKSAPTPTPVATATPLTPTPPPSTPAPGGGADRPVHGADPDAPAVPGHEAMGQRPPAMPLAGKLLERIEASTYSYLRIQPADVWAAVPVTQVAVGADIAVADPVPSTAFESKSLGRTFDRIYFGKVGAAGAPLAGKLLERLDSGEYSYLRIHPNEAWAAVPQTDVAVGADVEVANPQLMVGFESKTLGRRFDQIYFGRLAGAATTPPPGGAGAAGGTTSAVDPGAAVPKADGPDAKTIAEVFAQKTALADKPVAIHARVVKFMGGVMGKNWLHVRDGSGTDAGKDNDLTVTTQDMVAIGDVVLVKGPVHLDRDFGSGYAYAVIVEDASVTK